MTGLVVGFDLDMTLIDTRPGFGACLQALGEETGVELDVEAMTAKLGPPLELMLEPFYPAAIIPGLVTRFRELYPDLAVRQTVAMAGAHDALEAVRSRGGRVLVITGKFTRNAWLHTDHLGFGIDDLVGEVWGHGKGAVLREHGARIYVGDHIHDVEGALTVGARSVSVLTGGCTEEELLAAGTHVVLRDLTGFPAWLEEYADQQDAG